MANNPFLEEFAVSCPGNLQRRLADAFDGLLRLADDEAAAQLKVTLDAILQERIDATGQD
ncbi:MAG: hypothetical protein NTX87_13895 [Planctomycetota bacterium]|nr:hypothetical protein [Planctomycetota bacterium]